MPVVQQGAVNTTALIVPDLYVQIVPPQNLVLNGVPTDVLGVVGTASWGPVNQPVVVGSMADYARLFGPVANRRFDMGTQVATSVQQGAANFRCVRVTDGTDTAAYYALFYANGTWPVMLTAQYSGSLGNQIGVALSAGAQAGTWRLTLSLPGQTPEVFDNLAAPSPAVLWANLVAAVNQGQGPMRGPSRLVVASLGGATGTPPLPLSGQWLLNGSDGTAGVTAQVLLGSDTLPRKGMYALRGQGCALGVLADSDDASTWTAQAGFGLEEGIYMVLNMLLGTLAAMATSVVSYWVGSSAGSAAKDARLAAQAGRGG